nr:xanthine dehydrogenase/oxidase-like [Ciona intestinalis]|eukprot:XP_026690657.1 xanthine dehydrogenase/oxidase-like [Ciona intestinalis]
MNDLLKGIWSETSDVLTFYVNGSKIVEKAADPETTLLSYLRRKVGLTGTKLGCGEGGCGACTVMVSKWNKDKERIEHLAVNACLARLVSVHKCSITTVEGIGSVRTGLHAVQERISKFHGSQCGFCTPGIVMSMYALLRNQPVPSLENIESALQGNLCRCTGYRPILSAFQTFTKENSGCPMGAKCCKNKDNQNSKSGPDEISNRFVEPHSANQVCFKQYDGTQEPIFPPELLMSCKSEVDSALRFVGENVTWYTPITLEQLTRLKTVFPDAPVVSGNTEVGIETGVKGLHYPVIVTSTVVLEMAKIEVNDTGVNIGASCTLTDIKSKFLDLVNGSTLQKHQMQPLHAMLEMIHWFAGDQIRNVAVIGGNIMTASPISDINPILMACGATATLSMHEREDRKLIMDQNFFPSYRKTAALKTEVLSSIFLPFTRENEYMKAYTQSKRREDDIAIVNCAMRVQFYPDSHKVKEFSAAFGGMAATTVLATSVMNKIVDRKWEDDLIEDVALWLREDFPLKLDTPGGMVEYREALALSFFFKFYIFVKDDLSKKGVHVGKITENEETTQVPLGGNDHGTLGTQTWQEVSPDQNIEDMVGRPIQHESSQEHATGEAKYVDDIPTFKDELYMCLVTSERAHAKILEVDISSAATSPGFVNYIDHHDVPGVNEFGCIAKDDIVFAVDKVTCVGQVIGAVVADTEAHARLAVQKIKVKYEDILPKILTIKDAMKHGSYFKPITHLKVNDAETAMKTCDDVVEGEIRVAGQEHFYMEPQGCLVVPKGEKGEMEIFAATQSPTELQDWAAEVLGVDYNKIVVRMKRMGGGFGGKETRFHVFSNPAVVAANKCGKPIRCVLTRQEDMQMTGQRHPFYGKYKVGFTKEGKFVSLILDIYNNGGNSTDLSGPVLEKAILHADHCYSIPNISITGYVCKTNISSNTAFRGFGAPQGMIIAEDWVWKVATKLNVPHEKIREMNMYKEGDFTHFGQQLEDFYLKRCWEECLKRSKFTERKSEVEEYNSKNRWRKRGISCIPTKFGISFADGGGLHLNQAGALVHVYKDGSVLVTHGGTEMGQGLHTKMIQVASKCLGISVNHVYISESGTNTVPNTSATAASTGADLNGMAVKVMLSIIFVLKPLQERNPGLGWEDVVMKAYLSRISLSATGFHGTPEIGYEWDKQSGLCVGRPFNYFTYGVAVSEVEVDCLTGDHIVRQTDIVMDCGKSLNPAIDIGQIEGAFTQGYGLFTLEEPLLLNNGHLLTKGPGAYKIPGFGDCPHQFNVHLLRNAPNKRAIFSSKGVGEPPLFLAASVFFAIKNAIVSARIESGLSPDFRLDSPATVERIRMSCGDKFTLQHQKHSGEETSGTTWCFPA